MTEPETKHIVDQIETYLSDGLSADERLALEAHAAACPMCGRALADAKAADAALRGLFQHARPPADFEDRIIRDLRFARAPRRSFRHPAMLRAAAGVAATILLAGTGVIVSNAIDADRSMLHLFDRSRSVEVASNMRQIGRAMQMYRHDVDLGRNYYAGYGDVAAGKPATAAPPQDFGRLAFTQSLEPQIQRRSDWGFGAAGDVSRRLVESKDAAELGNKPQAKAADAAPNDALRSVDKAFYFHPAETLATTGLNAPQGDLGRLGLTYTGRPLSGPVSANGTAELAKAEKPAAVLGVNSDAPPPPGQIPPPSEPAQPAGGPNHGPAAQNDNTAGAVIPAVAPNPSPAAQNDNPPPMSGRKIIRNGTMEFEVTSFEDALTRITKLVNEQGGFVGTTDSDKLPNGKIKGTVTVRVPPEHLDTLILTLRGIGELKTQKITAEDVTKHYTDLASQLRAAQAMYDRLTDIIKTGKGQIKDLVEAEKQLGIWEEKIEQIKGEQQYLKDLVSLSTLTIELYEKDIKTPASASETEQVNMSLETEAVDDAYSKARDIIATAKGRVVQAELKQFDAGQFGATIQAAIPPDAAEQTIARLRQLQGRIAHFSRDRRQTTQSGVAVPIDVQHVTREDVVVALQIYNLANIAPRLTTSAQLAANNVERAYQQIIQQVRSAGGRIVTSTLAKPDANQQTADLDVQVPAEKADAIQDALRTYGEVMGQDSTENPDTANVTEAKRGFHIRIVSLAAVAPRETQTIQYAATDVPAAFNDILNAVKTAGGRVLQSDLNEQNPQDITGTLAFDIPASADAAIERMLAKSGQVLARVVSHSADIQNTVDTKLRLSLTLMSADRLPPRETITTEREEVPDVQRAVDDLVNAAVTAGGHRVGNGEITQDQQGHSHAGVVVEVPLNKLQPLIDQLDQVGYRVTKQVAFNNAVPQGPLARGRIEASFSNTTSGPAAEESTWAAIRRGLATSGKGLRLSLQMIVIGLCFVAPWVLILWVIWRLFRRSRSGPRPAPAAV